MKSIALAIFLSIAVPASAWAESGRQVHVLTKPDQESYMWTMTKDTFFGSLFGALVGGAVMLVTRGEADPIVVAYTTAGGMLLGAGFGVWEIADRRDQVRGPPDTAFDDRDTRLFALTLEF